MQFTQEQAKAITTHDKNLIVVAGAGSGKTRVLVERYLALLEANPDWRLNQLVAITFTKKAAQEMRDRVRRALLHRFYTAETEPEQMRWSGLLNQMDSARIDTIHGLCAALLRANAAEAAIDPEFEVLDENEAALLLEDTADDLLKTLAQSPHDPLTALLHHYDRYTLRQALTNSGLLALVLPPLPGDLMAAWQADWQAQAAGYMAGFYDQVAGMGLFSPADDALGERWQVFYAHFDRLAESIKAGSAAHQWAALNGIAEISFGGVRGSKKAYALWGDEDTYKEAKDTLAEIRTLAKDTLKRIGVGPGELDEVAALLLPLWCELLRRLQAAFAQAKARHSALDFDDLERLTCTLLQDFPQVRARYRQQEFMHLLVDEFQDTNAAQWQIVKALADLHSPGTLFVVGDPKQSIYAFRGADVSVFGSVMAEITQSGGLESPLAMSFRTHAPLVACFNALFERLLRRDEHSPVAAYQVQRGDPMRAQRQNPPDAHPHIELILIDQYERDAQAQPRTDGKGAVIKLDAEARRQWEAQEVAGRIQAMISAGYQVYDKDAGRHRAADYGDFALLFRALTNLTLYEEVFKAQGLPFVTLAGRGYYDRQEVHDLLHLLEALYNPADDLALAVALRSPLFGLSDDALFALRLQMEADAPGIPVPLWEAIAAPGELLPDEERGRVAFAHDCLWELRAVAGRVTVSELLRRALELTGYLAVLTGLPDGARRRGNVEKLLQKAESSGRVTLEAFTRYLRDLSTREVRESEATVDVRGAVQIMTIHASKGLEFPVVVLVDSSRRRAQTQLPLILPDPEYGLVCRVYDPQQDKYADSSRYQALQHLEKLRDEAESLRLLYVAMTRAQDKLLITGQVSQNSAGDWKAEGWLNLLLDEMGIRPMMTPGIQADLDLIEFGGLRLHMPMQRPAPPDDQAHREEALAWPEAPPQTAAHMPPLLATLEIHKERQAQHLAATHIADLGSARLARPEEDQQFYRQRFRRQVLQDAPTRVDWVSQPQAGRPRVKAHQVGEIVHEALRYWRLPGESAADQANGDDADAALRRILYHYAWRQGITDEARCQQAMRHAYDLLLAFKNSHTYEQISQAKAIYREVPFIYERGGTIIHGIIDVLFQTAAGEWYIADYKTSALRQPRKSVTPADLSDHARRYHLQLGIYAAATQAQLQAQFGQRIVPRTFIHYIRYNQAVYINEQAWREALSRSLTEQILEVIQDD